MTLANDENKKLVLEFVQALHNLDIPKLSALGDDNGTWDVLGDPKLPIVGEKPYKFRSEALNALKAFKDYKFIANSLLSAEGNRVILLAESIGDTSYHNRICFIIAINPETQKIKSIVEYLDHKSLEQIKF